MKEPPYGGRLTRQDDDNTFYVGATIIGVLFELFIFMSEVGWL